MNSMFSESVGYDELFLADLLAYSSMSFGTGDHLAPRQEPQPHQPRKRALDVCTEETAGECPQEEHTSKKQNTGIRYSCPFRKRNPLRFNVRDHQTCATQWFSSITLVKRHVTTTHQRPQNWYACARCEWHLGSPECLEAHKDANVCPRKSPLTWCSYEHGISSAMEERLRDRRASKQVMDWKTLWMTIFPEDKTVPSQDFEPILESHDLMHRFFDRVSVMDSPTWRKVREILEGSKVSQ